MKYQLNVMKTMILFLGLCSMAGYESIALSCTRVLYAKPEQAVLVGNNMDWFEDMKTNLMVYPEGMERDGKLSGNVLKWTSKYGSIVATAYDSISTNGMNEKGFAAHLLALDQSDYGNRDEKMPGMLILMWAQFYLDNFQTVDEAIQYTQSHPYQIVTYVDPRINKKLDLHLALEDAKGDSAIIEFVNGTSQIYHSKEYTVLTNEPTFDQQLTNLKNYAGFGGDKPLPGTTLPQDRFVRASYYVEHLPKANSTQESVLQLLSVMQNAGQPYGVMSPERKRLSTTMWRTISDLTHHTYYFTSTMSFNMFWVNLDKLTLRPGSAILKLDLVNHPDYAGDVTSEFKPI